MYTIHDLCRISKLSRSTILYYDSLGLIRPVRRSASNYRVYSEDSLDILSNICLYRQAGVSLSDIGVLIRAPENGDADGIDIHILEKTLFLLNNQARDIHDKQRAVIDMITAIKRRNSAEDTDDELYQAELERRISTYAFNIHDNA